MKGALWLLLVCPAFASAQQTYYITSGTSSFGYQSGEAPFTVAGADFSSSGTDGFAAGDTNPLDSPVFGKYQPSFGDDTDDTLHLSLTLKGVPWAIPQGTFEGGAVINFSGSFVDVTHPGTYKGTFTFSEGYLGAPESEVTASGALGCQYICSEVQLDGAGTYTIKVVPYPYAGGLNGALLVSDETFTFKAVPEPSVASLLMLGLAGLGVPAIRRRRAS